MERGSLGDGCQELPLLFHQKPVGCFSWPELILTAAETRTVWSWPLSDSACDISVSLNRWTLPRASVGGAKWQSQGWNPIRDITGAAKWLICMVVCPCTGKRTSLRRSCVWQLCSLSSTVHRPSAGAGAQLLTVQASGPCGAWEATAHPFRFGLRVDFKILHKMQIRSTELNESGTF